MTRIHFGGAEVPQHREVLARLGVDRVAFNVAPVIKQRSGNAGAVDDLDPFETIFYSSQYDLDESDVSAVINRYADHQSRVIEVANADIAPIPLWDGQDLEELYEHTVNHGAVCIEEAHANDERNARALNLWVRRNPSVRIFCITSRVSILDHAFITDAIVNGWIDAQRYRELQVWDGTKVHRTPKANREVMLDRYQAQIGRLGIDHGALCGPEPDPAAYTELAIRSWLQYELVTNTTPTEVDVSVPSSDQAITIEPPQTRHRDRAQPLPVMRPTIDPETGASTGGIDVNSTSMRQCDLCSMNKICGAFEAGAYCAFNIPVHLRTDAEVDAGFAAIMEWQMQRVATAVFEEQMHSQGADPRTSQEIALFVRIKTARDKARESQNTLTIKAQGSGGGLLSEMLNMRSSPRAIDVSSEEIRQGQIEEAQVVDE